MWVHVCLWERCRFFPSLFYLCFPCSPWQGANRWDRMGQYVTRLKVVDNWIRAPVVLLLATGPSCWQLGWDTQRPECVDPLREEEEKLVSALFSLKSRMIAFVFVVSSQTWMFTTVYLILPVATRFPSPPYLHHQTAHILLSKQLNVSCLHVQGRFSFGIYNIQNFGGLL